MLEIWGVDDYTIVNKYWTPIIRKYGVEHIIHDSKDIDNFRPQSEESIMMCCGTLYLEYLQNLCVVAKGRVIGSLRNKIREFKTGNKLVISYSPSIIKSDYSKKPDILWDIELACMADKYGKIPDYKGNYREVKDFSTTIELIKRLRALGIVPISVDLETMGSNPRLDGKEILSMSVTVVEGSADVIYFYNPQEVYEDKLLLEQIKYLLTSNDISIRGANFKYDLHWFREKMRLECTNFKFDTLLVGSLLDENRSNSQNILAKVYSINPGYDDEFNETYDKSKLELAPKEAVIHYNGGDTDCNLRIAKAEQNELCLPKNEGLLKFYTRLLHPAARAFELIEGQGVCVNKVKYLELWQELDDYLAERAANIWDIIPSDMYRKPTKKKAPYNPVNPTMIKEYMFTKNGTLFTDKGVLRKGLGLTPKALVESAYKDVPVNEQWNAKMLSVKKFMDTYKSGMNEVERKSFIYKNARTTMKHFKMFEDSKKAGELIKNVKEYTLAKKTLSTYVKGFLEYLDPTTEKFYPTYMLFRGLFEDKSDPTGTNTGRSSLFGPALQQLPKHTQWSKKLRSCFTAPPGMMILNVDFSEGELRLIADRSGDPVMIEAYRKGLSLHAITAARLLETPLAEYMKLKEVNNELYENIRRNAKVVNFGLPYGMSGYGLRTYAEDGFGLILSKAQSDKYVDDYFSTYKAIKPWHDMEKTHAKNKGYVTSALGRVRHIPMIMSKDRKIRAHAERQAVNAPIQSCLSDMLLLSVAELDKLYRHKIFPFLMIHDNLLLYVPENEAVIWAKRIVHVMENLPLKEKFNWEPRIPIVADAEIGYDLANLKKVEKC